MDDSGIFYVTPYHPIIKAKPIVDVGLANMYYLFDEAENNAYQEKYGNGAEITALYFGTREGKILIWEKGMDLPVASDKVEALFGGNN